MAQRKKPAPDPTAATITTAQASALLGLSENWINRLHKEGFVGKAGRGRWKLDAVVQGYISWLKDEERRHSKSAAHSRMTDLKAVQLEMKLQRERGELVPLEDARLVLDTASALMTSTIMSVPARFTRDPKERKRLETLVAEALGKVADGLDTKAAELSTGEVVGVD